MLNIDDQSQSLSCQLIIAHAEIDTDAHPLSFIVRGALAAPAQPAAPAAGADGGSGSAGPSGARASVDLDDGFEIIEQLPTPAGGPSGSAGKRPRAK